jgi:hypothetical protein
LVEGKQDVLDTSKLTTESYIKMVVAGSKEFVDSIDVDKVTKRIVSGFNPKKLIMSGPVITSEPIMQSNGHMRVIDPRMSEEKIVEHVLMMDNQNQLPTKMLYEAGVKYLKEARRIK